MIAVNILTETQARQNANSYWPVTFQARRPGTRMRSTDTTFQRYAVTGRSLCAA